MMCIYKEPFEQLNQKFVRLTDQPIFKNQLSFFYHFEKTTKREGEKNHFNKLRKKQITNQSDFETSIQKINNELEAKIENMEMKGSSFVFDKITSMQFEMHKTKSLLGGIYTKLPMNNQRWKQFLTLKTSTNFVHCDRYFLQEKNKTHNWWQTTFSYNEYSRYWF